MGARLANHADIDGVERKFNEITFMTEGTKTDYSAKNLKMELSNLLEDEEKTEEDKTSDPNEVTSTESAIFELP